MGVKKAQGRVRAALSDVDGTLADTNYLHAVTWWEAFLQGGHVVPAAEIHRAIGMGSGQLLDKLLPAARDAGTDADIRAAHTCPGPGDLLAALAGSLLGAAGGTGT